MSWSASISGHCNTPEQEHKAVELLHEVVEKLREHGTAAGQAYTQHSGQVILSPADLPAQTLEAPAPVEEESKPEPTTEVTADEPEGGDSNPST